MPLDQPCEPWPIIPDCWPGYVDPNTEIPEDEDEATALEAAVVAQERAILWASTMLWRRSGRRFGTCSSTVRICPPFCHCTPCGCGPRAVLMLSSDDRPVTEITSIVNACTSVAVDPDRYAIIDDRGVGLIDRTCGWDQSYDCDLIITFEHGWTPDIEAQMAVTQLAAEYKRYCAGENCKTLDFLKLTGTHRRGKRQVVLTGLPLVDHFLLEMNEVGATGMMDPADIYGYTAT